MDVMEGRHHDCAEAPGIGCAAATAMGAALLLSACGGGGGSEPPESFFKTASARTDRNILSVAEAGEAATSAPALTVTELLDWAERQYPELFPGHQTDLQSPPYVYRF